MDLRSDMTIIDNETWTNPIRPVTSRPENSERRMTDTVFQDALADLPRIRGKVLVFIVAYEAEKHAASVLERIPSQLWNDPDIHFLMIDDASSDQSSVVASEWVKNHNITNCTILRNPINQGYGGNQKLGYRIAVDGGFDFVILLHGDGQYAPEMLPKFIETFQKEDADVVLGSRMTSIKSARAGGMAWYKVFGNRTLTKFQNFVTRRNLSEYHTGYRGYSTRFLKSVPFEVNTNQFHFDTEILLQAFHINAKVVEFPIPTFYGDEVCRVPGLKYAKDVIKSTLQFKMHQYGLMCSLKYRHLQPLRYRDKTQGNYTSHRIALNAVAKVQPKSLLDIGCGPGYIAKECEKQGIRVTGLDFEEPLPGMMSEFHKLDLDSDTLPADAFDYDAVLLLDVIEHIADPEKFLLSLRNQSTSTERLKRPPTFFISTPNIAFAAIRLNLLAGRFSYAERGILDITHKRLFTRAQLRQSLEDCGYVVQSIQPVPVPFEAVTQMRIAKPLAWLSNLMALIWPTMFAFQWFVIARPKPGVKQLIKSAERHSGT